MQSNARQYLSELYRSLHGKLSPRDHAPLLHQYAERLSNDDSISMTDLYQREGEPKVVAADYVRERLHTPAVCRRKDRQFLYGLLLLGLLLVALFSAENRFNLTFDETCVFNTLLPLLLTLSIWFFFDRGLLFDPIFAHKKEGVQAYRCQLLLLLFAVIMQFSLLLYWHWLLRTQVPNTGPIFSMTLRILQILSLLVLLYALCGYLREGKVYLLGIALQSLGLVFSFQVIWAFIHLMDLESPIKFATKPFLLIPYYLTLVLSLVYFVLLRRYRRKKMHSLVIL